EGILYLNPQNNAMRSECSQMLSNFLYIEPVYEINGNDLSLYTIVYPADCLSHVSESAKALSTYIEKSIGVQLPVVTDEAELSEYEILVGETNREEKGIVTIDRSVFEEDDQKFICTVQGNYLVIMGVDSDEDQDEGERNTYNIIGTENAVYYFLEEKFGLMFYFDDGIATEPDPVISLDNGYTYIDGPYMESRTLYIHDECEIGNCGIGNYYDEWGCGLPHQLGNLMTGKWLTSYENTWDTPCLSDPDNIQSLKDNIKLLLEGSPSTNLIGLIQNDSSYCCLCSTCKAIYREEGTRGGALVRLCNEICETFEESEPNLRFATWAYNWSIIPPKETKYHDNMILYYNTLHLCPAHEYSDTTCQMNKDSAEQIKKWGELTTKMYLWEHTSNFTDTMTPFPDLDSIRQNTAYLADNGCKGVFLNSTSRQQANFCELRGYLFNRLYRDPYMSEEEYYYKMNGFLKAFYGEGWQNLRKYINGFTELGNNHLCHSFHADVSSYYNFDDVVAHIDEYDAYWEAAMSATHTEAELERLYITNMSWRYLKQCALYESNYTNGSEAQKQAYMADSQKLYDDIMSYGVAFTENGDPNFNIYVSPAGWN
ncbi:MAG: DUF4838 domain-containing protein, partial [Clostridia bacterium]|nr:DUF4838 domain-containing protein [Clostridia bacterium]